MTAYPVYYALSSMFYCLCDVRDLLKTLERVHWKTLSFSMVQCYCEIFPDTTYVTGVESLARLDDFSCQTSSERALKPLRSIGPRHSPTCRRVRICALSGAKIDQGQDVRGEVGDAWLCMHIQAPICRCCKLVIPCYACCCQNISMEHHRHVKKSRMEKWEIS